MVEKYMFFIRSRSCLFLKKTNELNLQKMMFQLEARLCNSTDIQVNINRFGIM